MSVVATKVTDQEIIIAADSITTRGSTQAKNAAKLFETDSGVIIGGCGLSEQTILLRLFLETHVPKVPSEDALLELFSEFHDWLRKKTGNNGYQLDNHFHFVFSGKAFSIHEYCIREIKDYHAIGAGMDYALAALYLGQSPERAVEAATELSIYCEKPVVVFRMPRGKKG